jgi:TonB family protein
LLDPKCWRPATSSTAQYNQTVVVTSRDLPLDFARRRAEPRIGFVVAFVVALGLHLAIVPGAALLPDRPSRTTSGRGAGAWSGAGAAAQHTRVEWVLRERPAAAEPMRTPPRPETPREPEEPEEPRGQVVTLPAQNIERPESAEYLAQDDQRVERETRARLTGIADKATRAARVAMASAPRRPNDLSPTSPDSLVVGGVAAVGKDGQRAAAAPGAATRNAGRDDGGGGAPQARLEIPRLSPRLALALPLSPTGRLSSGETRPLVDGRGDNLRFSMGRLWPSSSLRVSGDGTRSAEGDGARAAGEGGAGPFVPGALSLSTLEALSGLPANDDLEVEEGDETALNALSYKHAPFFQRVADQIRREWQGGDILPRVDPTGQTYGSDDRVTVVSVTIDVDGNIVDLAVKEPSGAAPLDDEAVRSTRVAGPFSHPPSALFRGRERFTFTFGFHIAFRRSRLDLDWRPR